jgi:aminopeptidase N
MLRGVIGTEAFRKGIKSYYSKYQNLNASTADFRMEMEAASGLDLKTFFEQWLYKPGALKVNGTWQYDSRRKEVKIALDQVQTDGSMFKIPIQVAIYSSKEKKPLIKTIQVSEKSTVLVLPVDGEPTQIQLDPDSWVLMESTFVRKQ